MNAAHAADAGNGKALSESHNCAACHGPNLNNPVSGEYPKLAGQHATYVYWALRQYQMGNGNPNFGRSNAIMAAQVQNLSQGDLKDIAAYIESLNGSLVLKK
jgi:cytochrome c553